MYDFYKNPPNTIEEIKEYLTSWLEMYNPVNHDSPIEDSNGTIWYLTHGFRRAFNLHQVYTDKTNFAFNVDEYGWDGTFVPNMGIYNSWNEMIDGVAFKYAIMWKLV